MATPYRQSDSAALNAGPSRTLLQQLLEEINAGSPIQTAHKGSTSQTPASLRSRPSSQGHSPSAWVGGSSIAKNARDQLREADQAHQQRLVHNTVDSVHRTMLHLDTLGLRTQDATSDEDGNGLVSLTPDPIRYPHDYKQFMMEGSPVSTIVGLSPAAQEHPNTSQEPLFGNGIARPLSPLMFSDVDFDSSSLSPLTESTVSPTEAPTSAGTVYTAKGSRTPVERENAHSSKRTRFSDDTDPEASPQKRRTMTLPDIHSEGYSKMTIEAPHCFIGLGGDNRCVLRDATFTERAPTPRMSVDLATTDALPELSSFRPTDADPRGQPTRSSPSHRLARAFTSPTGSPSSAIPDTPAWMRPMHLIDTGAKSIYLNVHDDGPIHHALCLYCFRTHGSFCKVHKHGYETCGRTEVLDSHYWESDSLSEESFGGSTSSEC
ncbi:hypothetical protein EKO04_004391 [Ascochyta lentis]|uniref:Uncharacterized protein n=1 Tax=Ascochyta lentis TaxID=205686 RepID=A0A8H7MKT2_9PLEO|nr:hypothetical protein EKO04_004391 [Ascochyta lentis]